MSDPAEQQAAHAEFLIELALMHLYPDPLSPQPAPPADLQQALERMNEAMFVLYGSRKS